ncbi:hypothetical protein PAMP_009550 [Pampus punctatissimus]
MNSNHSAGEGRVGGGWEEGVYVAGGKERELWAEGVDVMQSDTSGEEFQKKSVWVGKKKLTALYGKAAAASVILVISALCLCGRHGNHRSYQML